MDPERRRWSALTVIALVLGACGMLPATAEAPSECGFPEGAALSYAGETSLAALGVSRDNSGDGDLARIFVTRDAVPYWGSLPNTPDGPPTVADHRQYCAIHREWLRIGGVADDWAPPAP
jgi:hypothetical protein